MKQILTILTISVFGFASISAAGELVPTESVTITTLTAQDALGMVAQCSGGYYGGGGGYSYGRAVRYGGGYDYVPVRRSSYYRGGGGGLNISLGGGGGGYRGLPYGYGRGGGGFGRGYGRGFGGGSGVGLFLSF